MKRRILIFLALMVVACAGAAVTAIAVIKEEMARSVELESPVAFEVRPGQSLRAMATTLREAGLIGNERIFLWTAAWTGTDRSIRHGHHEFSGTVTMASVLEELARTPKPTLRVTIPEGRTIRETAQLLEDAGACSAEGYRAVACSQELRWLVGAPPEAACAEGYLFPDTYDLTPGMPPGAIVDMQVRRLQAVVDPLISGEGAVDKLNTRVPSLKEATDAQRLAWILTLGSIVEKETGLAEERARIAAVFYNRLRVGMLLQTDPTVIYGVIESGLPWEGNLKKGHLRTPTPYNTYTRKGLPVGPICNPGRAAIEAVLAPTDTTDFYFVARGDGSHEFTTNLKEHNRAVRLYQLRKGG